MDTFGVATLLAFHKSKHVEKQGDKEKGTGERVRSKEKKCYERSLLA